MENPTMQRGGEHQQGQSSRAGPSIHPAGVAE